MYKTIIDSRLMNLRQEQAIEAEHAQEKLALLLAGTSASGIHPPRPSIVANDAPATLSPVQYSRRIDPEPHLKLRAEDKGHEVVEEADFMSKIVSIQVLLTGTRFLTLV